MNKYLSVKIKVISFLLMIMVVFIHSNNIELSADNILKNGYSAFIQTFFCDGINLIAVPLFFAISGYLFFLNLEGTLKEFVAKFHRRFKSLVVPYFFWSISVLILFCCLQFIPYIKDLIGTKRIIDYSLGELLFKIFIEPIPLQLWFIRDLIALTIISPVIYWLIRYSRISLLLTLLLTWFLNFEFIVISNAGFLFFVFGAYLSITGSNLLTKDFSRWSWIYLGLWGGLILYRTILISDGLRNNFISIVLVKIIIITGILAVWSLYDKLFINKDLSGHRFYFICSFSFFLYAFHIPTLNMFKRGLFHFMEKSDFTSLTIYFAAPILTISIGLLLGYYLKLLNPKFYAIITGGRQNIIK